MTTNNVLYYINRILLSSILVVTATMALPIRSVMAQQDKFRANPAGILQGAGPLIESTTHRHNSMLGYGPMQGTNPLEGSNPYSINSPFGHSEIFNFVPPLQGSNPLENMMTVMGLVQTMPMLPAMIAMLPNLNALMGPIEVSGIPCNPIMTIPASTPSIVVSTTGGPNPPPSNPPVSTPPITYGPPLTPIPPPHNCGACIASPN